MVTLFGFIIRIIVVVVAIVLEGKFSITFSNEFISFVFESSYYDIDAAYRFIKRPEIFHQSKSIFGFRYHYARFSFIVIFKRKLIEPL